MQLYIVSELYIEYIVPNLFGLWPRGMKHSLLLSHCHWLHRAWIMTSLTEEWSFAFALRPGDMDTFFFFYFNIDIEKISYCLTIGAFTKC